MFLLQCFSKSSRRRPRCETRMGGLDRRFTVCNNSNFATHTEVNCHSRRFNFSCENNGSINYHNLSFLVTKQTRLDCPNWWKMSWCQQGKLQPTGLSTSYVTVEHSIFNQKRERCHSINCIFLMYGSFCSFASSSCS